MPVPRMLSIRILFSVLLALMTAAVAGARQQPVRMWEEEIVFPTYGVGEPERNPVFYDGKVYQGARGVQYPYALQDDLTDDKRDRAYDAVYLENEYVRVCVIPELGGRLFSAVDKTDNYDFFYRQHVIKPGLIGVLGAWISGGVEWNVPHHHRPTTFMPMDYELEEHPDGSRTVWIGEIELRHRLRWVIGLTLRPGRSWVEVSGRIVNTTPLVNSFLFWANVAVHADSSYQIIFPPSQEWGTGHGKHDFTTWPLASTERVMGNPGYTTGDDLSMWKSHPSPISIFAFDSRENFVAGYDHNDQAGVVHVADYHTVPGKKLWEWGPGPAGRIWDEILTDKDGPYIEIMVGAFSDNQPDYSWIQPGEIKTFTMTWYPLRDIGGVKNANLDAAVNLEVRDNRQVLVGFNASRRFEGATVRLTAGETVLLEQKIELGPARPFVREVALPRDVDESGLRAVMLDESGEEVISYTPVEKAGEPEPPAVTPPPAPAEFESVEKLVLAGQRLEQFHSAALDPDPYYEEAVRRDPGHYRANLALGILWLRRGDSARAEQYLKTAIARVRDQHTRPRDGEALYYLGVVSDFLGKRQQAYDAFFDASWSAARHSESYLHLARLESRDGNLGKALEFVRRSLRTNTEEPRARALESALLRKLGHPDSAAAVAGAALERNPLDFTAANELQLALEQSGNTEAAAETLAALTIRMRDWPQNYLETAIDYGSAGLYNEALDLLERYTGSFADPGEPHAMAWYYMGYYSGLDRDPESRSRYYRLAREASTDYVFPFRLESIAVLGDAMKADPRDARAPYYLGNLLFQTRPERAVELWERSRELDDSFATVHRNLAIACARVENDPGRAVESMERAVELDPDDPRLYLELDQMYEAEGLDPEKRLDFLEDHQAQVLERDDLVAREIVLHVLLGNYDKAIDLLDGRTFQVWEGRGEIHDVYVDAHLARGEKYFRDGEYEKALEDYRAALEYPENLRVGRPRGGGRDPQVLYYIGTALDRLGRVDRARESFEQAVSYRIHGGGEVGFYQALALRELGRGDEATDIFDRLEKRARESLEGSSPDFFAKFGDRQREEARRAEGHYLLGLGLLGKGKRDEAREHFRRAMELDRTHRRAGKMLDMI